MDEWKTLEPRAWKPEKAGEQIVGVLVAKEPRDEIANLSARYHLETPNGVAFLWGSAVLDDRMQYVHIEDKVRITYEGKRKNKRNQDLHLFKVEVARTVPEPKNDSPPVVEEEDVVQAEKTVPPTVNSSRGG
jgi:hypothetical protein